jgi:hypothetical protein
VKVSGQVQCTSLAQQESKPESLVHKRLWPDFEVCDFLKSHRSLTIRRVEISVAGGKLIFFVKGDGHRAASDILIASPDFNEIF